jgi:hypothetical protein
MAKAKIYSISNTEKTLWIRIKRTESVIKDINSVLIGAVKSSKGICFYNDKTGEDYLPKYSKLIGSDSMFYLDEESVYLMFFSKTVAIVLRKDSKHYDKLHKLILDKFKFVKNKYAK